MELAIALDLNSIRTVLIFPRKARSMGDKAQRHASVNLGLRRQRQADLCEYEASLVYMKVQRQPGL